MATMLPFEPIERLAAGGRPRHQQGAYCCLIGARGEVIGLCVTDRELGRRFGVSASAIHQYRRRGLSTATADRLACAIDLHPLNVWPDW